MRYDSGQFGSFDGRDNRRELMILFQKLGERLPRPLADERRADFLRKLVRLSGNGFASKMARITPCDPVAAYWMFGAITGCLGVSIDRAARLLDEEVRRQ